MKSSNARYDRQIIFFCRYPEPGKAKTRLVPYLGPAGAADLHRELAQKTLDACVRGAGKANAGVVFCYDGGDGEKIKKWIKADVCFQPQSPGDIGLRMSAAIADAFTKGAAQAVLIGSDVPDVTPGHLSSAFTALAQNDVALGPSTDGGYWLVGMNRPEKIFDGIDWSTDKVLRQTLDRAGLLGLSVHLLETLTDVDTADDIENVLSGKVEKKPYVTVVIPALNEEENIAAAIESAGDRDARIIVVDGGSHDRTRDICREMGVACIRSKPGRARQQNHGAMTGQSRMLLFLHADTCLPKGYVSHVFDIMLPPDVGLGAFRFKTDIRRPVMRLFEAGANIRARYLGLPYGDQALFMRRSDFLACGGFPRVPVSEDLLMVRRMRRRGKLAIADAQALTSGRRWRQLGILRTFLINQVIMTGILTGVSPEKLAPLYRVKGGALNTDQIT